ncbi:MAG: arsenosugar biosynthesis radical SAM (seleno)protein ArsS [Deltaproteobacteria bacterium]|nr:arsenosugar biosynthesis radical SAM (seleno)protein ArsS [Deltaproteobacteria bacterium]
MDCHVIDRCNLTVLLEPGFEDLATFLAQNEVEVVASMPCYLPVNVDALRGKGVFDKSIRALRLLNRLGYGKNPALRLILVHNPNGADLPPNQEALETDYRRELERHFGIEFNRLYAFTNLPIGRFAGWLKRNQKLEMYMHMLKQKFNRESVYGLMCRHTINVDWRGQVFDCDFNQQLNTHLGVDHAPLFLWDLDLHQWLRTPIRTGDHCFGCTAGQGASCQRSAVRSFGLRDQKNLP